MQSPFPNFKLAQFQFFLKSLDFLYLPEYKGSTLRGAFGHAFKKVVCVNREKLCSSCLLKGKCVYSYVFETPPPPDTSKMRKYPYAPHPFVITPPLEGKRQYRKDEPLCFELTLIGKSIDYLPYFIYTFDEMGRIGIGKAKGKYQLEEVRANQGERSKEKGEREELVYSGKDKILHNNFDVIDGEDLPTLNLSSLSFDRASNLSPSTLDPSPFPSNLSPFTLHLSFLTPTRLKFDGRLSPKLEFHILIRNLLRRISLLSYFHCDAELDVDFKGLIEKSREVKVAKTDLTWFDWERYSNRQETTMMLGGFIGSVAFEGDLEPFLPFLLLGEYIHVGKATSFGLGKYKIIKDSE